MHTEMMSGILTRDLRGLRRQLEAWHDERDLWITPPGIANSAGNLALHMVGNLRAFVGGLLGGSGYVRERDAEFRRRDVPRGELLALVDAAIAEVGHGMAKLSDADLAKPFPMTIAGATITTADFLMHLIAHLAYHLGQMDYLRRLRYPEAGAVGALSPLELTTAKKTA